MAGNKLYGGIPHTIGNLTSLTVLYLNNNSLSGSIPSSIANLTSLTVLYLYNNELTGSIPPSIGNLISLTSFALDTNQLSGSIPHSIGRLSEVKELSLSANSLSGGVPPSLWNLSSLSHLSMSFTYHLSGSLPPNIGQALPLLETFYLAFNQFHGPIPMSLSNASRLQYIELGGNSFSGIIPPTLGRLRELQSLFLYSNHLETTEPDGWTFLTALTNCTQLEWLTLSSNKLRGVLPNSIANLSTNLQGLYMDNNYISGKISSDIGNLVNLMVLRMDGNSLYGSIPSSIGMLRNLHALDLGNNKLSGEIPSTIGNLTQLNELYLDSSELSENIPVSLGKCQNLIYLNLGSNKLTGSIPKEIVSISRLSIHLSLASNSLSGPIPSEIGSLINVNILDFSMNKLSGEIPITLSECQVLEELYVGGNLFQGSIPSSLASLRGIQKLDFSKNNLSGKIPDFLQDFHGLNYLNLSFNNFEGEVPLLGVFANASAVSVIGNSKLCGGNPEMHLPACPSEPFNKKHGSRTVIVICGSTILFILVILLFCFLVVRRCRKGSRRKSLDSSPTIEQNVKVTYGDLVRATDGFSEDNIIGTGSFGRVYKGLLDVESTKVVAVKVLNLQIPGASRTFIAECNAVKNIRHRNLLKILTVCSSVDFKGNDFKAVVFEFMENGSLDDWLHPKANEQSKPKKLDLTARLDIAIDVAYALDYLHHQCGKPIVHCDLKPSNILLDDNITAHVGDFGFAKFLKKVTSQYSTSSAGLRGTIGYIAPEYGMGNEVSTCGDVYSYGILLLEMFTGKRPTDDMFVGGLTLPMFVKMAFPEQITNVIDAHLLTPSDDAESMNYARATNCMASILRIGISCSNELPAERMETDKIIKELHIVRDMFMRNGNYGERQRVLQSGEGPSTNIHRQTLDRHCLLEQTTVEEWR
ncbi:uncharacterized protein A4U43_C01F2900 [Asparagus officinalis]|uniref:Receptor kinase-like protein Xa21 n=2 Tax=Asparagus officinalis TaxID=4686 RepID=A0A5P1FL99_ASPOF|nr:uncharacterized protein A4U43_C01F2900 [Asparagus officinalis]